MEHSIEQFVTHFLYTGSNCYYKCRNV